jgi:bifunctional non-homologous end joining protein LigD
MPLTLRPTAHSWAGVRRAWMRPKVNSYRSGRGAAPTRLPRPSALLESAVSLRPRTLPTTARTHLPASRGCTIRVIARKNGYRVKLYSRPGNDLTPRFPLIVDALARMRSRSCIIDGEAVACGDDGIALFERIRYRRFDSSVFMYAFDLIELNGDDLRLEPLEWRKAALERLLARAGSGVRLNEHRDAEGPLVFEYACRMCLERIVSKRKGSWYSSGRSREWMKAKNTGAPRLARRIGGGNGTAT